MIKTIASLQQSIGAYFQFEERETNFYTESIAGLSTYLSLAYIFIVNPAILAKAQLDPSAVLFATVCASAIATLAMGFWANLPFAVAPGLSMNGFFAFVVCGIFGATWQQGLGTVFISGVLCIVFTAVGIRKNIISSIPNGLKQSIATSVGVFVAIIGLYLAHIVTYDNRVLNYKQLSFSSLSTHYAYVLYVGLFASAILGWPRLRFAGGMIIAIVIAAVLCHVWGINGSLVPDIKHNPFEAVGQLELSLLWHPMFWSPILVFFILDFMEGIGVIVGLTSKTTIQDKDGNIPNFGRGLYVDGGGTVLGSLLGTSSLIMFVESAVGIKAGGRTGLTAIICGLLMAMSIMFAPMITLAPPEAAAGVLLYVGYLLLPVNLLSTGDDEYDRFDIICSLVMGLIIVFSFSLDKAMAVGFWAYFLRSVWRREVQSGAYWLGVIAVILTFSIVWQFLMLPHP